MSEEGQARQLLSFQVDGEDCAVDLAQVREIVRYESATRVPRVSECVRGVVNLRGNVVPVVDLAVALGRVATPVTAQTCLLVVETPIGGERTVVGLMVGSVSQVLELEQADVEPPPSFGTKVPADVLLGVARVAERFVFLVDLERLLGSQSLLASDAAAGLAAVGEGA